MLCTQRNRQLCNSQFLTQPYIWHLTALFLQTYKSDQVNLQRNASPDCFPDSPVTLAHPLHFYHLESVASTGCFMKGMCSCPVTLEHELLSCHAGSRSVCLWPFVEGHCWNIISSGHYQWQVIFFFFCTPSHAFLSSSTILIVRKAKAC